jgi:hypothetical protein
VEHDLVLLLGDGRAVERLTDVGVGDRLALDGRPLLADRHLHRLGLGDDALAQPGAARLDGLRADREVLLGARHRVVGVRPGGVVPGARGRLGGTDEGVVRVEALLLGGGELLVVRDARGVLDELLVVGEHELVPAQVGVHERDEAGRAAEQAGAHGDEGAVGAGGRLVDVDDLADLLAVLADGGRAGQAAELVAADHGVPLVERTGVMRWR